MPSPWNPKDNRQFKHVLVSEKKRGRSQEDAEEIAARTVNKQRRREGRSLDQLAETVTTPHLADKQLTVRDLRRLAAEREIPGRSRMRKAELIRALAK